MRETTFLKQNEKKWREFEQLLGAPKKEVSPDKIADLFIEITDDLAYARTHYPDSSAVRYLNGLAGQVHLALVKNKRVKRNSFWHFWKETLPLVMAGSQTKLLYSFLLFALAAAIGAISTLYDENFLSMILGSRYVEMTKENIANGDPMGVYGSDGELSSFLWITVNNIKVSFLIVAAGLVFSAGTALLLLQNGVMLGAFHAFLYQYGQLEQSLLTVYIHGTLEISAIIIAGAAGFHLGHSLLFPRTYSRLESLQMGARKAIYIVFGLVPIFILAGFLEGFVTRHTEMPWAVNMLIILISGFFILFYFVVYPWRLRLSGKLDQAEAANAGSTYGSSPKEAIHG